MRNTDFDIPNKDNIPEIYCSLAAVFSSEVNATQILDEFGSAGIDCFAVRKPKVEPTVIIEVAVVRAEKLWSIDEALSKLFSSIDKSLCEFKRIVMKHNGTSLIDIAFYQYGTYPSLFFQGENMKKIHFLSANISIDPFWVAEVH